MSSQQRILPFFWFLLLLSCQKKKEQPLVVKNEQELRITSKAIIEPVIDGEDNDPAWQGLPSYPINQLWMGKKPTEDDFIGNYKICWTPEGLCILATIIDDVLYDGHANPLTNYWDDDCLEIFIDADNSGGDHRHNFNAFAYHIALNGVAVDLDDSGQIIRLDSYITSSIKTKGKQTVWELFIPVYDENFCPTQPNSEKILKAGDRLGFAVAYCDNDGSASREHFIGSVPITGKDKNRAWIDAGTFGTIYLIE